MQDYFKYDKIQTGTSLFMKSDSDGSKDKQDKGLPLGIKTTAEGIKHFNQWDSIANSIDKNKGLRFDDLQPNSINFSMPLNAARTYVLGATENTLTDQQIEELLNSTDRPYSIQFPEPIDTNYSFKDSWEINDINIIDDVAFVSSENYTDIHRKDISLTLSSSRQYWTLRRTLGYDTVTDDLFEEQDNIIIATNSLQKNHSVACGRAENSYDALFNKYTYENPGPQLSNNFISYDNCILEVEFDGDNFTDSKDKKLYFTFDNNASPVYTGLDESFPSYNIANRKGATPLEDIPNESWGGTFRVQTSDPVVRNDFSGTRRNIYGTIEKTSSDFTLLSLSLRRVLQPIPEAGFDGLISYSTQDNVENFVAWENVPIKSAKLIKIQPVRKCGKVDVYVRKRGIITAAVNNRITSPGHGLETNDIIKITSALFDGAETGAVDIHPLNGEKFVKKIDDDTFDLYEDQFLEKTTSTNNLRTTDGISWVCISSSNGQFGQSWDYYKTLFSPTGKNGYPTVENANIHPSSSGRDVSTVSGFVTDNRIKAVKRHDLTKSQQESNGQNINLDFTVFDKDFYEDADANDIEIFTNYVHEILDKIPESTFGKSFYDLANKAPHEFYPFNCKDDSNEPLDTSKHGPYTGTRFGCSMDVKFKEMSGDSKVYVVAIGERGSDVSVDFFGIEPEEHSFDYNIPYASTNEDTKITYQFRQRIIPMNLVHGRVHLFEMVVDKYGKITSFTHKNTIFGDGDQVDGWAAYARNHPWGGGVVGSDFYQRLNNYIRATFNNPTWSWFEVNKSSLTDRLDTDFSSAYWDRAACAHWFGTNIWDYFSNSTTNDTLSNKLREISATRNSTPTTSTNFKSRFGEGAGYPRIDRFNEGGGSDHSQWYICPWVDSFGKSVAIGDIANNIEIFGAATTFSNTEPDYITTLRPVFLTGSKGTIDETKPQIGQICLIPVGYISYGTSVQAYEINSGGASLNYYQSNQNPIKLKTGTLVGSPYANQPAEERLEEVYNALHLSATKILYKDGYLIWADQVIGQSKSIINILKRITSSTFTSVSSLINDFSTDRSSGFVGDGFGADIRYDNGLLVTNCMSTENDFGETVTRHEGLMLYDFDKQTGKINFLQRITPTFSAYDTERYPEKLLKDYENYILDLNNITYEGDPIRPRTWNVKLIGRYDIVNGNVLLRDPIEFSLFGKDVSIDRLTHEDKQSQLSTVQARPYLYFTEHFKNNQVYYDYSAKNEFIVEDKNIWEITSLNTISNLDNLVRTPVFFLDILSSNIDNYNDLTISFNVDTIGKNFLSTIDQLLENSTNIIDNTTANIPKLVLYAKDPRSVIIPNGPSDTGSSTSVPFFTDGIFTSQRGSFSTSTQNYSNPLYHPPLFRGGANDLYFYGSLAGSAPQLVNAAPLNHYYGGSKTLGELFDLTYNQAGNTNKGIISWSTLDGSTPTSVLQNLFPYAALISGATIVDGRYQFTIPYETWKNYLIRGSFIKSSSDNRPMFDDFTRISHGTLTTADPFTGSWSQSYDDANQPSYSPRKLIQNGGTVDILPNLSLAIGFVMTSVTSVDLRNNSVLSGSFGLSAGQKFRTTESNIYKNPYSIILKSGTNFISNEFRTKITDIEATIQKSSLTKRRYKNVYHKIAYFEYNNEIYSEAQKHIIETSTQAITRYGFGKYSFSPFPIGVVRTTGLNNDSEEPGYGLEYKGQSYSSIIRAGTSSASAHNTYGNDGTFAKSTQILTSDNIVGYGASDYITSNYYFDSDADRLYYNVPPAGLALGAARFSANSMLGSFDITNPDFLSLSISAVPTENINADLFTEGVIAVSENITTSVVGIDFDINNTTLWIGKKIRNTGVTLNISGPDLEQATSLWIEEVPPSSIMPLNISGPDTVSIMPLVFRPPTTGSIPLYTIGPIQSTGNIDLSIRGKALSFGQSTLYASGIGRINNSTTIALDGVLTSDGGTTLHAGSIKHNENTTLQTYGAVPVSSGMTLNTKGRGVFNQGFDFHIGTQYEVDQGGVSLAIKDTERPLTKNTTLHTDGRINSINSLTHGEADYTISRNLNSVDISQSAEEDIVLTFNGSSTQSNALVKRAINVGNYTNKTITPTSNSYFGSARSKTEFKNPAFITKSLSSGSSNNIAFYSDESTISYKNNVVKRNAYDANGGTFAAANNGYSRASMSIDVYDITFENKLQFNSKLQINLGSPIPSTSQSNDIQYAENGISDSPYGESFIGIRRALKTYFDSSFVNSNIVQTSNFSQISDLKISSLGTIAISTRVKIKYENDALSQEKTFNVIIIFDKSSIKNGTSNVSGYSGRDTYYTDDYRYHIFEEFGTLQNKTSSGYNLSFDGEDVYFDRRLGQLGQIWKSPHSSNHSSVTKVIDYGQHPDFANYISANNGIYVTEENKRVAFGVPFKIYDDYYSDGKIMFVGAHLFDPYMFNTLTQPHIPNPIGAVYIYKKALGSTDWTYFGAVYGKGYTSDNVISNLSEYRNSSIENKQYCLFGYDFDYSEGNLVVSEPGGNGSLNINIPKAYLFKINDSIELLNTYSASDILMPDSSTLSSDNNFGTNIILLNGDNPITYSDSAFGRGALHSLRANNTIISSLAYIPSSYTTANEAKTNIKNEIQLYQNPAINNYDESLITRTTSISSIRLLNFGEDKQKIGIVRRFRTRLIAPADTAYNFDIDKLFIQDLRQEPFTLFISGPQIINNNIDMFVDSIGRPSGDMSLAMRPIDYGTGLMPLFVEQRQSFNDMPLHMESPRNNYVPLNISGEIVPNSGLATLQITPVPFSQTGANLYTSGIALSNASETLFVKGDVLAEAVNPTTLFIGQEINASNSATLNVFASRAIPEGYTYYATGVQMAIEGRDSSIFDTNIKRTLYIAGPDSETVTDHRTLFIQTDTPPTVDGGIYIHSGNIPVSVSGSNDGSVFTDAEKSMSLSIVSTIPISGIAPLYIERPKANNMSLFVKNQNPSGIMTAFVSGAYVGSGSMTLNVAPPEIIEFDLFTRGYLE